LTINEHEHPVLWRFYRFISRRAGHYCRCFNTPDGRAVLTDLAPFCFANAACRTERDTGRRDVWLHIQKHLKMNEDELAVLFAGLGPEARHKLWKPDDQHYLETE
jgi:hypothetical protein